MMKKFLVVFFLMVIGRDLYANDHLASTIEEALTLLKKASAGDKIILKDGVYKDASISFHNPAGTKDSPITFTAQTPGKVSFEGSSTLSFSGNYIIVSGFTWQHGGEAIGTKTVIEFRTGADKIANHCTFTDCAIIGYNSEKTIDNKWISLYGEFNTVSRCLLKDKNNLGATVTVWLTPGKEAHHTICSNYFNGRQNGPDLDNGLESIRIGDSKTSFENSHCVVALNRFENCDGEIEIISNKSFHNSYLHNTFYNNDGGLTLRHGNECLVDGNVFDGGTKPKSYGVRFIGEGHVAINNYFYNLHGSPTQNFRAAVTLVTGVVNTPINGYFQVRRAVVADNIFVNCATPNIRVGATPNREGATLVPDTVTIKNNLFYADNGVAGNVYEEEKTPKRLVIENNKVAGKNLEATEKGFEQLKAKAGRRDGFDWIKDGKGNIIASNENKAILKENIDAGASWIEPSIAEKIKKWKYTLITSKEAGPDWMNK